MESDDQSAQTVQLTDGDSTSSLSASAGGGPSVPFYKKPIFIILIVVVALLVIGGAIALIIVLTKGKDAIVSILPAKKYVLGTTNVSSKGTPAQSSTSGTSAASMAIDADSATASTFSMTTVEQHPWFTLTFPTKIRFGRIVIRNRSDVGQNRLRDITITISNATGPVLHTSPVLNANNRHMWMSELEYIVPSPGVEGTILKITRNTGAHSVPTSNIAMFEDLMTLNIRDLSVFEYTESQTPPVASPTSMSIRIKRPHSLGGTHALHIGEIQVFNEKRSVQYTLSCATPCASVASTADQAGMLTDGAIGTRVSLTGGTADHFVHFTIHGPTKKEDIGLIRVANIDSLASIFGATIELLSGTTTVWSDVFRDGRRKNFTDSSVKPYNNGELHGPSIAGSRRGYEVCARMVVGSENVFIMKEGHHIKMSNETNTLNRFIGGDKMPSAVTPADWTGGSNGQTPGYIYTPYYAVPSGTNLDEVWIFSFDPNGRRSVAVPEYVDATQTTTHQDFVAFHAIDGNPNSFTHTQSFLPTAQSTIQIANPALTLSFLQPFKLREIVIRNRLTNKNRLQNISIQLLDESNGNIVTSAVLNPQTTMPETGPDAITYSIPSAHQSRLVHKVVITRQTTGTPSTTANDDAFVLSVGGVDIFENV